ncbi:MAG: FecR domain-containing protein, partial [Anaerotignum sp.]|nr:FecR domain-containing protein [Anaerotignum sp.]
MKRIKKFLTILLTIAMVVSLLPATAFAANNTATTMRLAKTQGTVTVTNATGKNVKQTGNMKLYNGYKVKTGAKSYAWVSLDDTKVAKLDANSVMEVQKQGKSLTLYLSSGNMFFNVKDPLKSGETFSIKTSTMTTGIRGTSGCVRVISPRVTEIHLLTGEVQVYAEHPVLGLSKTATLKAGQKATSLIDWEAIAATGEMVDILIERLENHEICGVCSKEIANDPALLERIEREAPHLLPEKAAAEADERLAADEAKAEEKQAAIEKAIAEQVFPEDVDPYFEKKEGGGGGGAAASKIVNVATWGELLQAIQDYNAGSGTTQINLTATIDARNEQRTLPPIDNKGALTLNLGTNELYLNGTLYNEGDLTITNVDGYIYGNGSVPAVQNDNILTLLDGQIDGAGRTSVVNNAGTFYMRGGELVATAPMGNMQPLALDNMNGARAYLYGGTVWSGAENTTGAVGVHNRGHLTISGATLRNLNECVANLGTVSMTSGLIESSGRGVDNQGNFRITGGKIAVTGTDAIGIRMITNDESVITAVMDNATITATGGYAIHVGEGATGTLSVNGGTVSGEAMGAFAIHIESADAFVSVGNTALIRAKGEETVFQYAADDQWPVDASIIDDTENSGYWRMLLPQGGEAPPYNPPVDPEPDVPIEDPIDTWADLVQAVADFNRLPDDGSTMTVTLGGNIPATGETNLAAMAAINSGYKYLVIDLNNHGLTLPQTITVAGNLKIIGGGVIDSTVTGQGTPLFNVGSTGSITLDENTTTSQAPTIDVAMNQTAIRGTQAGIYMNAGKILLGSVPSTAIYADGGTVEMSGGEIQIMARSDNWANMGIQTKNNALVKVTGGTIREGDGIEDATNDNNYAIYADSSTVELTGGTVSVHNGTAVYVSNTANLTLGSAAVTGKDADKLLAVPDGIQKTGFDAVVEGNDLYRLINSGGNLSALQQFVAQIQAFNGTSAASITLTDDVVVDAAGLEKLSLNEL